MRLVFGVELVVGQDEQEKKIMCTKCFAVALGAVVLAVAAQGLEENDTLVAVREDKSLFNNFFSPLTVVRLSNELCTAPDGTSGTCVGRLECAKQGGTVSGVCGKGFGVCCVTKVPENGVIRANNTLILKETFNDGVDISYTVAKVNDDICQYRIDVKELTLDAVGEAGDCFQDYFKVNQDTKFSKVCGKTIDVHYYFDVTAQYTIFTFHTSEAVSLDRRWEMYVSQYTCDMGAPQGCGQWYWGTSGTINMWNNIDPNNDKWYYVDDQEYAICVRTEATYCSVSYVENQPFGFAPKCNDLFERPGTSNQQQTCATTPPSTAISYTVPDGLQYFYVKFKDNTNTHLGSASNPYGVPIIQYTQNKCT